MKKVCFLLAIILLVSGQVMCTSCGSSNDEYENKNQPTPPDDNEDPEDPGEEPDTKSLTTDLKNLSSNTSLKMWTCAHRSNTYKGIRDGIPENSIPAIQYAIEVGADMIEIDPRATSDGVIVNMHNTTINATTNGTGAVANMTYQTLYQYFLKGSKGITEYKVPTLEEVLDAAKGKIYVCVDVKEKGLLGKIIKTVAEKGMIDQVCYYTGSSTSYIEEMNTINPGAIPFPWVSTAAEVKVLAKYYSKVQMVQFGIDNASLTELMGAIKDAKLVGYANHLDWDSDLLNSKYSHLQTFIDNKIEVVQTDYSDLVNSYLKEKGLR